jgi:preprotein translocase subunit SecA
MRRAAIVLVAALTAACGSSSASSPGTTAAVPTTASLSTGPAVPPVAGIEAEAVRQRTDEALGGQVQTRLTTTGDAPFTVTSVALDSSAKESGPAKAAKTATVSGGKEPSRNAPCPCGSGKKYKFCHGAAR